ncbi:MAG: tetratricopeptide repeat protein [Chloroflexi bacterium]|nr:tetratricopeptide repeat protein [Chloroflexota bacterium]
MRQVSDLGLLIVRDESAFAGEREYLFLNPTVRGVSYEGISPEERQEAHSRVAAWLVAHSDKEGAEHLGLIADHLEKGGRTKHAAVYLQRAGEQAATRFANADAIDYLSRALDLTPGDALIERYTLLLAREKVYDLQGAREAQDQELKTLGELAETLDDDHRRIEVTLRQADYAEATGDYSAAAAAAKAAIRLAQTVQDVSSEAMACIKWGLVLWRQGDLVAAHSWLEQALALAQAVQLREVEADILRNLGTVSNLQGDFVGAKAYNEQALHIYREVGHRLSESRVFNNLAIISKNLGNYVESKSYLEEALRICREVGNRRDECSVLNDIGVLLHHLRNDKASRQYQLQALAIMQEVGDRYGQGYGLTYLGHALAGLGRLTEAADAYQEALDIRRELDQPNLVIESLAGLARVSLTEGNLTRALVQVEQILHYLDQGSTLTGTEEPMRIHLTCYRVLRANGDPRAQSILDVAHQALQEQADAITDEEMRRSFLENVPYHREIVREFAKMG